MSFLSRQTWTNSFLYQISLTSSSLSLALLRKCFWRPRFFQLPPKATNYKQNAESVVSLCNVFQLSVVIDSPDNHPRASFAPRSTKLSYSAAKLSECASSSCQNDKNTKSVCDVYINLKSMQKQKQIQKKAHLNNYTISAHPSSCCKTRRVRHGLEMQNLLFKILPAFVCFKCPIVSCDF